MGVKWVCGASLALFGLLTCCQAEADALLFSFFRGNGEAGIFLAWSQDGFRFEPLNGDKPILPPAPWPGQNLTRDPSILFHDGSFHAVWTTGWKGQVFGYARSADLVHWSEPLQVRPFPEALPSEDQPLNVWAPEIHWDPLRNDFAILFSSTTPRERDDGDGSNNNGKDGNDHLIYVTRTADGKTYSPAQRFFDQNFSVIDAQMARDGERWAMVVKQEQEISLGGKNLRLTFAPLDLSRPWEPVSVPVFGPGSPLRPAEKVEGACLVNWQGLWRLYTDAFANHHYSLATSTDLRQWADATPRLQLPPDNPRHGTFFRAPRAAVGFLKPALPGADIELTETCPLAESHSIGWVKGHLQARKEKTWDGILDEARWGVPSPQQLVERDWAWNLPDEEWRQLIQAHGEGKREDVTFDLWVPGECDRVSGVVAISGHGSGEALFRRKDLRSLARELHLALFKFLGNPVQRGFWPRTLLDERLKAFGERSGHSELEQVPRFLYGHSNGTGFSAIYPAAEGSRVWAWVAMRPGTTFQVCQPAAAKIPGLVIFGEEDPFFARPSKEENLAVVPLMRRTQGALWNFAVEPKTGHGPGEKTWPLVLSFLRHSFAARVSATADGRAGQARLLALQPEKGWLGQNWDPGKGGYQTLEIAPFTAFSGDKATASWLINGAYAADWQTFQRDGQVRPAGEALPQAGPQ